MYDGRCYRCGRRRGGCIVAGCLASRCWLLMVLILILRVITTTTTTLTAAPAATKLEEVQQVGSSVVAARCSAGSGISACADGIHQAGRELGIGEADWWCGRLGQKCRRIDGSEAVGVGEGRRVGVGVVGIEGLASGLAVWELRGELVAIGRAGIVGSGGRAGRGLSP